jgi:hypothetical protein
VDNEDFNPEIVWDLEAIGWRGLHGAAGGYMAAGVGGIMQAGKVGAFKGKGGIGDKVEKQIGDWTYGKAMELNLEAGGFTGTSAMINFMETGSIDGGTGEGIGSMFVHNFVTVGVLKGMKWMEKGAFDKAGETFKYGMEKWHQRDSKKIDKILEGLRNDDDVSSQELVKELTKHKAELTTKVQKDIDGFKERINKINLLLKGKGVRIGKGGKVIYEGKGTEKQYPAEGGEKGFRVPNLTYDDAVLLIELVKDLKIYKDSAFKGKLPPEEVNKLFEGQIFEQIEKQINRDDGWADTFLGELKSAKDKESVILQKRGEGDEVAALKLEQERADELQLTTDTRNARAELYQFGVKKVIDSDGNLIPLKKASIEELNSALKALAAKNKFDLQKEGQLEIETGDTIEKRLEKNPESLDSKTKEAIKKTETGDKEVDGENAQVLELLGKSKVEKGKKKTVTKREVTEAIGFAKWLFDTHGISLKRAQKKHLQQYLDEGKGGKPFGHKSQIPSKRNRQKRLNIMRWVGELAGIKGQGLRNVKGLKQSEMALVLEKEQSAMIEKGGAKKPLSIKESIEQAEGISKQLGEGGNQEVKVGGARVKSAIVHLANFLVNIMGKRRGSMLTKEGDINSWNMIHGEILILPKDTNFGKKGDMFLKVRDKVGEGGEHIVVPVPNEKIFGINYYEVFKENFYRKGTQKDTILLDIDGKPLTDGQIRNIQAEVAGSESRVHQTRDQIEQIGRLLDDNAVKNPYGKVIQGWWKNFAEKGMMQKVKTIEEVYYGAGVSKEIYHQTIVQFWNEASKLRNKPLEVLKKGKKQISLNLEETKSLSEIKREVDAARREDFSEESLRLMDSLKESELERTAIRDTGSDIYKTVTREIETTKKLLAIELAKSQLTVRNPLHAKALHRIVTLLASRNKGLEAYIKKHGKEAGEFVDGMIKVTEGKADATTFFHENVHRLEDVIEAIGDKKLSRLWKQAEADVIRYAKKHHSKLYAEYDKGYGFDKKGNRLPNAEKIIANELMTQLSAESALRQFSREGTWLGRSRNLINRLVSQLRTSLGFGSMKDVARIYGDIARRGFSTEGMKLNIGQKKYQIFKSGDKPSRSQESEYNKVHEEKKLDPAMMKIIMSNSKGLWDLIKDVPAGDMRIDPKTGKVTGADSKQLALLTDIIKVQVDTHTYDAKISKNRQALLRETYFLRSKYGITTEVARKIAKELGVPGNGSIQNASEIQLGRLKEFYGQLGKETPPSEAILNEAMLDKVTEMAEEIGDIRKAVENMTMSVTYVLRKMGFKKLSHKIADHYLDEATLVGIQAQAVYEAQKILGAFSKNPVKRLKAGKEMDFIPFAIDKELLIPTELADGRVIEPKANIDRDAFLEKAEHGSLDKNGKVTEGSSPEFRAVQKVKNMFERYWKEFLLRGHANIKNPASFEKFLKEYKKKYVQDYFTRVLTKEASKHLKYGAGKEQSVENLMKKGAKIEIEMMEKEGATVDEITKFQEAMENKESDVYLNRKREAEHRLLMMIAPQPTKITNKNLLDRQPRLDNTLVTETGKQIQTYETDFGNVVGKYSRNMSNFLATMKHMPEFTDMRSYMNFSGASGDVLEAMRTSSDLGAYVDTIIRRRIGMNTTNQVNKVWTDILTYAGKGSALFGLSSPFSGLKNLVIGTQMTIGVHGFHAFAHGLKQTFNPMRWKEAREKGWLQLGTKELELKGLGEWWMKNVSRMTGTEAINRVIGGFAGEFNARMMVNILGAGSAMTNLKQKMRMQKQLVEMFNLKSEEIAFIERYGLDPEGITSMGVKGQRFDMYAHAQNEILNKIQHYGHIKSQGASGDPFLPLWAGHPNAKAMTLFYRMAYSGTSNVFNHIIKPARDGNFLPMARYGFAANVGGAALWGVYESVLGQKPPKMNETQLQIIGQNMAKAEALGLYSFLLNPYSGGKGLKEALTSDSIMQPAIIRNTFNLGEFLSKVMRHQEVDIVGAGRDLITDSFVAAGHLKKFWSKQVTPFKTDIRNLRTFRSQFEKTSGLWEEYNKGNPFSKKHNVNSEYYNLIKDAFSGTEKDMQSAARYYVATWYYLYDSYRVFEGYEQFNHKTAKTRADSALNNVIKKINPIYMANYKETKKLYNTRSKFLQYLKPEERTKALQVEKQYYHKLRMLNKLLKVEWDRQGGYYSRGKIIDMFPFANAGPDAKLRSSDLKKLMNI